MTSLRNISVWLILTAGCAGATIVAVKTWDGPLGLRKQIANFSHFGQP